MITAVDTNILLDVLIPDAPTGDNSQRLLEDALRDGEIVISEVVYAELAAHFLTAEELARFLVQTGLRLSSSQPAALAIGVAVIIVGQGDEGVLIAILVRVKLILVGR